MAKKKEEKKEQPKDEISELKAKFEEQALAIESLRSNLEKTVAALNQLKERNRLR